MADHDRQDALRHALNDPACADPAHHLHGDTWLVVAYILGDCRRDGSGLGEDDGTLTPGQALAAGRFLLARMLMVARHARNLKAYIDDVGSPAETARWLIDARMAFWSAFVAIDESYQDVLETGGPERAEMGRLIDQILDATDACDDALKSRAPALRTLLGPGAGQWLDGIRATLAGEYALCLPWWLDGTLG